MNTIESYGKSGNAPKGSIGNPYTIEELDDMTNAGTWTGGYVLNMGYVLPEVDVIASLIGSGFVSDFWDSYHWSDPFGDYFTSWDNEWEEDGENSSSAGNNHGNGGTGNGGTGSGGTGGGSALSKQEREALFATHYPLIAVKIGVYMKGSSNCTTCAIRFAYALNLPEKFKNYTDIHEGDRKGVADAINAVRHTLWQAVITARYGIAVAKEAGDAHEDNPYASLNAIEFRGTNAFYDADQTIDLLNNRIGREIGRKSSSDKMHDIAYVVLEEFYQNGLYTAKRTGKYSFEIVKERISTAVYNEAIQILSTLDEEGFTPEQRME